MYKKFIKSLFVILCGVLLLNCNSVVSELSSQTVVAAPAQATVSQNVINPLDIVTSPSVYLHKKVTINAKFDKFSTLGLDYKPAYKSSDKYISFLIKRNDTQYDIPLSEMKLFLKRDYAEKFIDLKTDDEVQILGEVFSDALGDAWVDVEKLMVINKAPEKDGVN